MSDARRDPASGAMASTDMQPSPTALEMADALRSGVALRREQDTAAAGADALRLAALGDLAALAPVAKPGAAAPIIRLARRLLQILLRPWLAMQTIFNHEIGRRFDEAVTVVRDLRRRLPLLEQSVQMLDARVRTMEAPPAATGADGAAVGLDLAYAQRLFVHSRLPPPPATILLIEGVDSNLEAELANLGYEVVRRAGEPLDRGEAFAPESHRFDAIVARVDGRLASAPDAPGWALVNVTAGTLAPGARAVALLEAPTAKATAGIVNKVKGASTATPWRVVESLVCADSGWLVTRTPVPEALVIAMTLVLADPADVPAR